MQIDRNGKKSSSRVREPRDCYSSPAVATRVNNTVSMICDRDDSMEDDSSDEQLPNLPASFRNHLLVVLVF
jgi:hypothetical protein